MLRILSILSIVASLGCSEVYKENLSQIKSETLDFIKPLAPYSITSVGDYVLVTDLANDSGLFSLYSLAKKQKLISFGTSGQGPNEFGYTHFTGQNFVRNDKSYVWLIDWDKLNAVLICLEDILVNKQLIIEKKVDFHASMGLPKDVHIKDDSTIVGIPNIDGWGKLQIFNSGKTNWIDFTPKLVPDVPFEMANIFYDSKFDVFNDTIYLGMTFFEGIEKYSMKGELLKSSIKPNQKIASASNSSYSVIPNDARLYTNNIFVSKNYIYQIEENLTFEEFGLIPNISSNSIISLYDKELDLVSKFSLGEHLLICTFNKQKNILVAIIPSNDKQEIEIIKYNVDDMTK